MNEPTPLVLWYDEPAREWTDALPVGNGRLGAMVFGGTDCERLQLNEESVWAGRKLDDNNPEARSRLDEIRRLLLADRNEEATELSTRALLARPPGLRSYQTLMDLELRFASDAPVSAYRRELDLTAGIARTEYEQSGVRHRREVFVSAIDDVIVVTLDADRAGSIDLEIRLERAWDAEVRVEDGALVLVGQIQNEPTPGFDDGGPGLRFAGMLVARAEGGAVTRGDGEIGVRGADRLMLLVDGATDYDAEALDFDRTCDPEAACRKHLSALGSIDGAALRQRHVAEHSAVMRRVTLDLGGLDHSHVATDERLAAVKTGAEDLGLLELHFQYGRYLLAGSSRAPGVLPANLQGIWCKDRWAPWGSDFHTNINLQMNYWHADVTNLAETNTPLLHFIDRLRAPGRVTARSMYGARGWTVHHDTDAFGRTGLHDGIHWGTFPMGGPWMALAAWDHYAFAPERAFLETVAYPILRESAEFVLTFLFDDGTGRLVTAPSYSPENAFLHPVTGKATQLTVAPTMDLQIARELLSKTAEAAAILGVDRDLCAQIASSLERIPPTRVAPDGAIAEWIADYAEAEPGHRHVSHLFGLHPGSQIGPEDPELYAAARRTIEKRLAHGGGHTGWSRAWIANFYARLRDGDAAAEHLQALLARSTLPNLFDDHPPFQIDGNFGAAAAVAEMLVQSHRGTIDLLPALPARWSRGRAAGLVARGGFELDLAWAEGRLTRVSVLSRFGGRCVLRAEDRRVELQTERGASYRFDGALAAQ